MRTKRTKTARPARLKREAFQPGSLLATFSIQARRSLLRSFLSETGKLRYAAGKVDVEHCSELLSISSMLSGRGPPNHPLFKTKALEKTTFRKRLIHTDTLASENIGLQVQKNHPSLSSKKNHLSEEHLHKMWKTCPALAGMSTNNGVEARCILRKVYQYRNHSSYM